MGQQRPFDKAVINHDVALGQQQRPDALNPLRPDAPAGIGLDHVLDLDPVGGDGEKLGFVERRGEQDAVLCGARAELGHHQPVGAGEGFARIQKRAPPARQPEFPRRAPPLGQPLGIGRIQDRAVRRSAVIRSRPRLPRPACRERLGVRRPLAAIVSQARQTFVQIDFTAAETSFRQHRRDQHRALAASSLGRRQHHVRQAGRQRERGQGAPVRRDVPAVVEGAEGGQQCAGLRQGGAGRRIEKGQRRRVRSAPERQIEGETGKLALQDFRRGEGDQRARLRLVPQAIADPRLRAPRPAPPLIRRRAGDADGGEAGQAAGRIVAGHAGKPRIDHHPHAVQGQAGFGDGGRQHHLAPLRRRGPYGAILFGWGQRAVEWDDIDIGRQARGEQGFGPADFALTGQKDEHAAALLPQRLADRLGGLILQARGRVAAEIAGLHRIGAAVALDHRRIAPGFIAEQRRHPRPVQGRGHHQEAQVAPQHRLRIPR